MECRAGGVVPPCLFPSPTPACLRWLWLGHVRKLFYPTFGVPFGFLASVVLGFPIAFIVLTVMVRVIPYFVPPVLVLRDPCTVTTLGLSDDHLTRSG